jgi:hypothetical protein
MIHVLVRRAWPERSLDKDTGTVADHGQDGLERERRATGAGERGVQRTGDVEP